MATVDGYCGCGNFATPNSGGGVGDGYGDGDGFSAAAQIRNGMD